MPLWTRIGRLRPLHWLLQLLLVSYGLRLALVHQGGQLYFPDEGRYLRAASVSPTTCLLSEFADGLGAMLDI